MRSKIESIRRYGFAPEVKLDVISFHYGAWEFKALKRFSLLSTGNKEYPDTIRVVSVFRVQSGEELSRNYAVVEFYKGSRVSTDNVVNIDELLKEMVGHYNFN